MSVKISKDILFDTEVFDYVQKLAKKNSKPTRYRKKSINEILKEFLGTDITQGGTKFIYFPLMDFPELFALTQKLKEKDSLISKYLFSYLSKYLVNYTLAFSPPLLKSPFPNDDLKYRKIKAKLISDFKLYDYQIGVRDQILEVLNKERVVNANFPPGYGATIISIEIAIKLGLPVGIICSGKPQMYSWYYNIEKLTTGKAQMINPKLEESSSKVDFYIFNDRSKLDREFIESLGVGTLINNSYSNDLISKFQPRYLVNISLFQSDLHIKTINASLKDIEFLRF